MPQAVNWNKSSFCWATFRCKRRKSISAASSGYTELSTTGSVLSPRNDHLDGYRTYTTKYPVGLKDVGNSLATDGVG
jgi:hypothetical protein